MITEYLSTDDADYHSLSLTRIQFNQTQVTPLTNLAEINSRYKKYDMVIHSFIVF